MTFRSIVQISLLALFSLLAACVFAGSGQIPPKDGPVAILASIGGDLPVTALDLLPEGQRSVPLGYLTSQAELDALQQQLQPAGQSLPEVDFDHQLVLFARNIRFYNRIGIGKVQQKGDTLSVLAMETMSARPITDKVAISLVLVPRDGARFIEMGKTRVAIDD